MGILKKKEKYVQRNRGSASVLIQQSPLQSHRHKLDLAIEEKIFVSNDLEDLRAETLRTEQNLRSDIDVRQAGRQAGAQPGPRCLIVLSSFELLCFPARSLLSAES